MLLPIIPSLKPKVEVALLDGGYSPLAISLLSHTLTQSYQVKRKKGFSKYFLSVGSRIGPWVGPRPKYLFGDPTTGPTQGPTARLGLGLGPWLGLQIGILDAAQPKAQSWTQPKGNTSKNPFSSLPGTIV